LTNFEFGLGRGNLTPLVNAALASLVALQALDTAADLARRRLAELPAVEEALDARIASAAAAVDTAKAKLQESQRARRALEKDVAGVDGRLARFEEHKAAVKTNQEYTALLHEIATAKTEKDVIEERILVLMEEADGLSTRLKADEAALADAKREEETGRAASRVERRALEDELARLAAERSTHTPGVEARPLFLYEQLLKGRRGLAVVRISGETCSACHVRLRPHVTQLVRRNEEIVQCESCQRILYFEPAAQP
jgi:predicted  nucleic acid-binding Zn-ribbon protein